METESAEQRARRLQLEEFRRQKAALKTQEKKQVAPRQQPSRIPARSSLPVPTPQHVDQKKADRKITPPRVAELAKPRVAVPAKVPVVAPKAVPRVTVRSVSSAAKKRADLAKKDKNIQTEDISTYVADYLMSLPTIQQSNLPNVIK